MTNFMHDIADRLVMTVVYVLLVFAVVVMGEPE